MLKYVQGNVIDVKAELLINAANGEGWMGGLIGKYLSLKGVAETIHYADPTIEKWAKSEAKARKVKEGDVFLTPSGSLGYTQGILHAVTMSSPGQSSNIGTVELCIKHIIKFCEENRINTVTIPLLGTGTGKLNIDEVVKLYEHSLSSSETLFTVVSLTAVKR
ncbi:O-acetyl-ADP-ribose deacetylase (regulator of RNase III) [Rossellomorea marisflavi]